jgi:hypothetical protein
MLGQEPQFPLSFYFDGLIGDRLTTTPETRTETTSRMPTTSRTSIHFFTKPLGGEGAPE